jgi:hypothetical protein
LLICSTTYAYIGVSKVNNDDSVNTRIAVLDHRATCYYRTKHLISLVEKSKTMSESLLINIYTAEDGSREEHKTDVLAGCTCTGRQRHVQGDRSIGGKWANGEADGAAKLASLTDIPVSNLLARYPP